MSYVRVTIQGSLPGGEVFTVNPVFDPTGEFPGGVNQANLDAACQLIANRTVPTSLRESMSTSATRTGAKVEVRDDATDNLIALSQASSTAATAGLGTIKIPPQGAVVLSLRTNTPGASGRGRLYWPALGAVIDSTARMTTPLPATYLADWKSYLLGIRSDLAASFVGIAFDLAVRSKTTTHTTPHVTSMKLGNVIDTQRRRRDALPEVYVSTVFP